MNKKKNWQRRPVLGVDIGGVIVQQGDGNTDTSFFGNHFLATPPTDGVFDHLATLTAGPFEGNVHIISKAGPKIAGRSAEWLDHHDFFGRTGISPRNLHFVRERRDKAPLCARFAVTHFVDDRLDVLAHMRTVEHRFLFGASESDQPWAVPVPTWADVARRTFALIDAFTADQGSTRP